MSEDDDDDVDGVGDNVTEVAVPLILQFVTLSFKDFTFVSSAIVLIESHFSKGIGFTDDMLAIKMSNSEMSNQIYLYALFSQL